MRTESEMHDLVVAKVAAHRRRRTLLASAGGGVAAVLLLVAVAAGAASSGPDEGVHAGEGDPTSTTGAPTTTEPADETTTTTTAVPPPGTSPVPSTTEAPPATTTEPPATTTEPPPTTPTISPEAEPTTTVLDGSDGDLSVTVTITTDPARPGEATVRVQMDDPTGTILEDGEPNFGPGAMVSRMGDGYPDGFSAVLGDVIASCNFVPRDPDLGPGSLDESYTGPLPSGEQRITISATTAPCGNREDSVTLDATIVVP